MCHAPVRLGVELTMLLLAGVIVTGCAAGGRPARVDDRPVCFPECQSIPRVVIYGNLASFLPEYDATPALQRFLYGPNDYGKTALRNPQGMALLHHELLVCDQGQPDVVAIDLTTGKSRRWCEPDHAPRCPVDVAVADDARVFVADTTSRLVLVFDANGQFIEDLTPDREPGRRFRPAAVLVHDDTLYVGNPGDRRIDRYDLREGKWLGPFVPPPDQGPLRAPTGLSITPGGELLIADAVAGVVLRVTTEGQWLAAIGRPGAGWGEFVRPKQVVATAGGLILVCDAGRRSVLVFSANGQCITEIHEQPDRWPGWTLPMGLVALPAAELPCVPEPVWHRRPAGVSSGSGDARSVGVLGQVGSGDSLEPDSYVIVSDSLGAEPLTLLGVITQTPNSPR